MNRLILGLSGTKGLGFFAALLVVGLSAGGCSNVECGEGTLQVDGTCVTTDELPNACAEYTTYDPNTGRCENDLNSEGFGACGPNTERVIDSLTGIASCVGTGGGGDCELVCPTPTSGVAVCGRIYDVATNAPIADEGNPLAGRVIARVYEPLGFAIAGNPRPIVDATVSSCGYFVANNVPEQPTGLLAIGVDDGNDQTDDFVLTGVAFEASFGERLNDMVAFATSRATIEAWTETAGNPFGADSFVDVGVYVPIFVDTTQTPVPPFEGAPASGVAVASPAQANAGKFYFDDASQNARTSVNSALTVTGTNGTALVTNTLADPHSGIGGEPNGCVWRTQLAATTPDVVFVQVKESQCQ